MEGATGKREGSFSSHEMRASFRMTGFFFYCGDKKSSNRSRRLGLVDSIAILPPSVSLWRTRMDLIERKSKRDLSARTKCVRASG